MASLKNLLKELNYVTSELVAECSIYKTFHPDTKDEAIQKIINDIILKRDELAHKIRNPKKEISSKDLKKFYNDIILEIQNNLVKQLDSISKI